MKKNCKPPGAWERICRQISFILLFSFLSSQIFAQTIVKGNVRDDQGKPVTGATVSVKGTQTNAATDTAGNFSIEVPGQNSILVFSSVGYAPKEEKVGNRTDISTTMLTSTSDLEQVIVVGYGTQKKRDVTGAISSVTAKTIEEKQPVTIFDALQGAAPGVRVMSESGAPGEEADITIRGISTLSDAGVRPLYVVDGVPMKNINGINPKDVQSIEILKDAASAAICGSRSANGVVLIAT